MRRRQVWAAQAAERERVAAQLREAALAKIEQEDDTPSVHAEIIEAPAPVKRIPTCPKCGKTAIQLSMRKIDKRHTRHCKG